MVLFPKIIKTNTQSYQVTASVEAGVGNQIIEQFNEWMKEWHKRVRRAYTVKGQ